MLNYEELQSKVVKTHLCTRCGACISACPNGFIKFIDEVPNWYKARKEDCTGCDKCYNGCYMIRRELLSSLRRLVFGPSKKTNIGVYSRILIARTQDERLKQLCQDGGIVTSILYHLLEEGFIDGALVADREGWMPLASVVKAKEQVIRAAGTKYGVVPILKELRSAIGEQGMSRICVVGSPCHIQAVRYLQHSSSPFASNIVFSIGLFCRENYWYKRIERKVGEEGLQMEDVDKIEISEEFNIWAKGKNVSLPITLVKNWVPKHCLVCDDFTSELADISVGSQGSPVGWSTVILRTEEGEKLFSELSEKGAAEIRELENLETIQELSDRKRDQAKYTKKIFRLKEKGLQRGEIAAKVGISEEVTERLRISKEWWDYRLEGF
jgi:coenzyme F420 hydrogenase subunit beta